MNYERIDKVFTYKEQDPHYKGESFDNDLANGPKEERKCRDCFCLLLYLIFWAALIVIAIYALANGNPTLLASPFDSAGNQCGYAAGYQSYGYAYYNKNNLSEFGCIEVCPTLNSSTVQVMYNGSLHNFPSYTTVLMVSICFPIDVKIGEYINLGLNFYDQSISDLQATWKISLSVLFITLFVSLLLMFFIRSCGGCLIFTIITLYFCLLITFGIVCYETAQNRIEIEGFDQWKDPQLLKNIATASWCFAGFSFLFVLCNLKKLRIATMVIKTTAQFTRQQCQAILVPIFMFIAISIFFAMWITVSIYIFSCGTVKQCAGSPYGCIDWEVGVKRSLGFYFFGLFWNCEVAIGMCQFVIASSAAYWYFSNLHGGKSFSSPVCKSFCRGITYHLGSVAFGALILCILFILQLIFEVLHHFSKNQTISNDPVSNACMKCCIRFTRCCLACFQRFIRFISKNAFIMMAITGEGFCTSAHQAFYLILKSSAQYAITHGVGHVIMFFGKLLISIVCTFIGYILITSIDEFSEAIYSPFMPTLIFFVISFVVASLFMDVFGIGSDTLLLCYCLEMDVLRGLSYACPAALKHLLDSYRR